MEVLKGSDERLAIFSIPLRNNVIKNVANCCKQHSNVRYSNFKKRMWYLNVFRAVTVQWPLIVLSLLVFSEQV